MREREEELTTISSREVGARMRRLREERGIELTEMARRVGVSPDQLNAWESGQGVAPYGTMVAVAEALATSIDAFVG
jgi:transcriptional regulator with XRE-family HTH domain